MLPAILTPSGHHDTRKGFKQLQTAGRIEDLTAPTSTLVGVATTTVVAGGKTANGLIVAEGHRAAAAGSDPRTEIVGLAPQGHKVSHQAIHATWRGSKDLLAGRCAASPAGRTGTRLLARIACL